MNAYVTIDIAGLDPVDVIQALYSRARPLGLGWAEFKDGELPRSEAESLVGEHLDYLHGRVMKVRVFDGKVIRADLYDRDNGVGAAQEAVDRVRLIGGHS
jgi:hypothetical protein